VQLEHDELPGGDNVLKGHCPEQDDVCRPDELPNVFAGQRVQDEPVYALFG